MHFECDSDAVVIQSVVVRQIRHDDAKAAQLRQHADSIEESLQKEFDDIQTNITVFAQGTSMDYLREDVSDGFADGFKVVTVLL